MALATPMVEYSLSVDNFNEPERFTGGQGILLLLTRLILLEPGTFDTHPDMGVGLLTYFRYRLDQDSLDAELQQRIYQQVDTYLPFLSGIKVDVKIVDNTFQIQIDINGMLYGIYYNTTANTLKTEYLSIADL